MSLPARYMHGTSMRRRLGPGGSCMVPTSLFSASTTKARIQFRPASSSSSKRQAAAAVAVEEPPDVAPDSFLHGSTANYVDEMYAVWRHSPEQVHSSWQTYFRNMEDWSIPADQAFHPPPGLVSARDPIVIPSGSTQRVVKQSHIHSADEVTKQVRLQRLVGAYRTHGHLNAKVDPLNMSNFAKPQELDVSFHGFSERDWETEFAVDSVSFPIEPSHGSNSLTLREIVSVLESVYCKSYGAEYQHIADRTKRDWIQKRLEEAPSLKISRAEKQRLLEKLTWATTFEKFLATKFPTEKRYGLDGAEGLAPAIATILDRCGDAHGVENVIMGSCHRGKLTMLATTYGKPFETILAEFQGVTAHKLLPGMAGDVKYHLGVDGKYQTANGREMSISLLPNPSHLEAIDPVATGKTYALQSASEDVNRTKTICLALHGDAAFAGQGIVYETLALSKIPIYDVGGTIRVMVNNQIGFTANPENSRSTPYCTDVAKYIDAPIFHVNGDDIESVAFLCNLAADWRATFHSDIVIDLVCFRRYGHNEMDVPSMTQPLMYQKIAAQKSPLEIYASQLQAEGSFTGDEIEQEKLRAWNHFEECFKASKTYESLPQIHSTQWEQLPSPENLASKTWLPHPTAAESEVLESIGEDITSVPAGFEQHRTVQRALEARRKSLEQGTVDWSTAEALAFGTLLREGHHVRVTGQDVQRGTFSQRHAVLHDQNTGGTWTPLDNMMSGQGKFDIANSLLSEFGALGFEYGFSLARPDALVMWEAQFGDFANNCQVIIDNFISGAESKWMDRSGIVLSLPHGYDGQGAEHSSARLERFLLLCNEGRLWPEDVGSRHQDSNMHIVYPTTPANYFHLLRRQIHSDFRKPLVIMFSKSLLRHSLTRSSVDELTGSSGFRPVLTDPEHGRAIGEPGSTEKLILCSGQVYASLHKQREVNGINNVAITRIEELHPFPWTEVQETLDMYPNAKSITWVQEEPYNGGAWHYVRDRLETIVQTSKHHKEKRVDCVSRPASATPAAGSKKLHEHETRQLLEEAFA